MRASSDRILTSHAGSLPRPDQLVAANAARESASASDERAFQDLLQKAVTGVVRKQKEAGIDVPGDGEFGKSMGQRVNYRAWLTYSFNRLSGLEIVDKPIPPRPSGPHDLVLQGLVKRRDRTRFLAAYTDPETGISIGRDYTRPVCTGPTANGRGRLFRLGGRSSFAIAPAATSSTSRQPSRLQRPTAPWCPRTLRPTPR